MSPLVGPPIRQYTQADTEDARTRRLDFKRASLNDTGDAKIYHSDRIWSTATTYRSQMTASGAKKEPSACALFGNGTIYLLGITIYLYYTLRRCVEALTRAGEYDRSMLPRAVAMFEVSYFLDLSYPLNHLSPGIPTLSKSPWFMHGGDFRSGRRVIKY